MNEYLMVRTYAELRQPQALAHMYIQCSTGGPTGVPFTAWCMNIAQQPVWPPRLKVR